MIPAEADVVPPAPAHPDAGSPLDPAFLSALAHELRNPLAPLVNALFLLRGKVAGDPAACWALDIVDRQVADLRSLLDDTADIARIVRGRLPRPAAPVDVVAAAEAAARAAASALAARKQTVRVDAAHVEAPVVTGDAARITRALSALLLYAARAATQGCAIDLRLRRDGSDLEIAIAPEDAGAASGERRPMSPAEASIGVAYAQWVAQWHEGDLAFVADPAGRPRFRLRLPLASEP